MKNLCSRTLAFIFSLVLTGNVWAADNAITVTVGAGQTLRSKDIGGGVQSLMQILGDTAGTALATAPGAANGSFALPVQGVSGGIAVPISGAITITSGTTVVTQGTAANLNATVVGTGTFTTQSTLAAETTKVIGTTRTLGNVGGVLDAIGQNVAAPANWLQTGCQFQTTPTTITPTNGSPLQCDNAANLLVNIKAGPPGLAQGSTTSGQTGSMIMGAVTTANPSYSTAQTAYASLTVAGALRMDLTSVGGVSSATGQVAVSVAPVTATNTALVVDLRPDSPGIITLGSAVKASSVPFVPASDLADPCQNSNILKLSVAINITTATTTSLVAISGSTAIYACGISMTISEVITTPNTIQFEYGTGATCGTGTTVLTGKYGDGGVTAGIPIVINAANGGTIFSTPAAQRLCALTAIGATASFQGVLTYVQL